MHIYMTDYGEVRVSDAEARTLSLADVVSRNCGDILNYPVVKRVLARAEAIKSACEKFARRKNETPSLYHWLGADAEGIK